jgi:hypothetical protein
MKERNGHQIPKDIWHYKDELWGRNHTNTFACLFSQRVLACQIQNILIKNNNNSIVTHAISTGLHRS